MSIIKKITIFLGIFFISGVTQLSAQEIKKIGKYKDWEAMVVMETDGEYALLNHCLFYKHPKLIKEMQNYL